MILYYSCGNTIWKQMKKIILGIILLPSFTFQSFCQEVVTKANFQLANNWTVQKQFKRTQNIWAVSSLVNDTELFTYKHVKENVYNTIISL